MRLSILKVLNKVNECAVFKQRGTVVDWDELL